MAGTLTQTQLQLQNAESSILFMQQEHAKTLQGLYAEINKLQKKCGEMSFKLAMNTTSSSSNQGQDQSNKGQVETAKELKELKVEHMELKTILGTKDKQILVLEGELSKFKKIYEEELHLRERRLLELTRDLNVKSDTVAYLTNQLHQEKLKQVGRKREERSKNKKELSKSSDVFTNQTVFPNQPVIPVPPRDGAPIGASRRSFKRTSSLPVAQDVTMVDMSQCSSTTTVGVQASSNEVQLRVEPARSQKGMMPSRGKQDHAQYRPSHGMARGNHHSAGTDRPPPEDYREFLKSGVRAEPHVVVRTAPEPLPPISSNEKVAGAPYTGRVQVSRGHPTNVADDVGTIIVSPLSSPEKGWRHRQQSQQQNSGPD